MWYLSLHGLKTDRAHETRIQITKNTKLNVISDSKGFSHQGGESMFRECSRVWLKQLISIWIELQTQAGRVH